MYVVTVGNKIRRRSNGFANMPRKNIAYSLASRKLKRLMYTMVSKNVSVFTSQPQVYE